MYVWILNHCDDIICSLMCLPTSHCVWDNNTTGNWHGASVFPHVTSVWPAFVYLMLSESAHNLDSPSGPKYRKQTALAVSVSLVGWVRVPWWARRAVICVALPSSWSWHLLPPRCATEMFCLCLTSQHFPISRPCSGNRKAVCSYVVFSQGSTSHSSGHSE